MQSSNYSFLDLTVLPFLRRRVISDQAAILFDVQLKSVLWANAAGTQLLGGVHVGDLLDVELSSEHELVSQIKNAASQLTNDEPMLRGFRVLKGLTSKMMKGELCQKKLPNGQDVLLLVFNQDATQKSMPEHTLAGAAVDCLEGFADAAAIVDEFGLTIASSSKFDDMDVYPKVLQDLVKETSNEDDRMIKRPIERGASKHIAAGIGKIKDAPSRYLIVLAEIDEVVQEPQEVEALESASISAPSQTSETIEVVSDDLSENTPPWNVANEEDIIEDEMLDTNSQASEPSSKDDNAEDDSQINESSVDESINSTSIVDRWYFNAPENDVSSDPVLANNEELKEPQDTTPIAEIDAPIRFSFTIGQDKIFKDISPEFANAVGTKSANVVGKSWQEVAALYKLDENNIINEHLSKADTWSGVSILWPVENSDLLFPIDLAALPTFTKNRTFDGFRGFGIIRDADAIVDPDAMGLNLDTLYVEREQEIKLKNEQALLETTSQTPIPGRLAGQWPSDEDAAYLDHKDKAVDEGEHNLGEQINSAIEEDEAVEMISKEETVSNVTQLNVVPIRSHVEERNSNVIDNTENEGNLTAKERSAFAEIKDRLQKDRLKDEKKNFSLDDVDTKTPQSEEDFNSAILIYKEDETLFANTKLLEIAGYASIEELNAQGGLEALLTPEALAEDNENAFKLRKKDGSLVEIEPLLKRVDWHGAKALSLTFSVVEAKNIAPAMEMDAPTANASALDMVQVSDLENILDTATDGVLIVNENGDIEAINSSGEALFGKTLSQIQGEHFSTLFAQENKKELTDYFSNLTTQGVAGILNDGREVIGLEVNGGMIPLFITFGAIGKSSRYCAVLRDLTQWKKSEETLVSAKHDAEAASTQKTEFLSRISHEIREPLNAIIGFSDVMIEERFGEVENKRYREYLRDINRSGNHMLDLVNDLLDLSKIEAGKLDLSYESVDLNQIARETVALLQPQANAQRIIIRISLSRAVPNVVADVRSVRQIIMNLVSNAIKHSPSNSQVIVSTTYEANGEVGLRIRDTGNGMNAQELKAALEPYSQLGDRDKNIVGTGLGLPLTKALIEANRAYFDLESVEGEGTIAHIQFPSPRVLAD